MKQVLVAGFHRSGTSMMAQMLHGAGLPMGERLVPCDISNPDGHFEDSSVVEFHDSILSRHGLDWRVTSPGEFVFSARERRRIKSFIAKRDAKHVTWGIKDPRISLFLDEWFNMLSNPLIICVYRHYGHCLDSLVRRHAIAFALNPDKNGMNLSFALHPELAVRAWKEYNRRIVKFVSKYPDRAVVVAQQALLDGAPLVQFLNTRFGLDLNPLGPSGVRRELLGNPILNADFILPQLHAETDEIWWNLESIAWQPSKISNFPTKQIDEASEIKHTRELLQRLKLPLQESSGSVNVEAEGGIPTVGFSLDDPDAILNHVRQLIRNDLLSQAVMVLEASTEEFPIHRTLLVTLGDLYRRLNRHHEAELVYYRAIAVEPIQPQLLVRLAIALGAQDRFLEAEQLIRRALSLNPGNPWFYRELAAILSRQEQFDEALVIIAKGREIFPDDTFIIAQEVSLLRDARFKDEAARLCLKALSNYPNAPHILMEGYRVLTLLGRPTEGEDFYYMARRLQIISNPSHGIRLEAGLSSITNTLLRGAYRHHTNNILGNIIRRGTSLEGFSRIKALQIEFSI